MNINNKQFNQRIIFRWLASNVTLGCQVAEVTFSHCCAVLFTTINDNQLCIPFTEPAIFFSKKGKFCLPKLLEDFLYMDMEYTTLLADFFKWQKVDLLIG